MANSGLYVKYFKMNKAQNSDPASFESWDIAKSKRMDDMVNGLVSLVLDYQNTSSAEEKAEILSKIKEMYTKIRDLAKMNSAFFQARNLFMKTEHYLIKGGIDPLKIEEQIKTQKKAAKESQSSQKPKS